MTATKVTPQRKRANATKKADDLFSKLVRDRDGCCVRCGTTDWLQCAHIWSRRYRATRWKMENAITLCRGCHKGFTEHPAEWSVWCEERRFCEAGICFGPDGLEWHEVRRLRIWNADHDFAAYSYSTLRHRALNDEPEKPADALVRLKAMT